MTTKLKRAGREKVLLIRVDAATHRRLKLWAAEYGTSIQKLVVEGLKHVRPSKGARHA